MRSSSPESGGQVETDKRAERFAWVQAKASGSGQGPALTAGHYFFVLTTASLQGFGPAA